MRSAIAGIAPHCYLIGMTQPPETTRVPTTRARCEGASDVAGTGLGHPRVWLEIDTADGYADCGYCGRRFVLIGGVADKGTH